MKLKECIEIAENELQTARINCAMHPSVTGERIVKYKGAVLDAFKEKQRIVDEINKIFDAAMK